MTDHYKDFSAQAHAKLAKTEVNSPVRFVFMKKPDPVYVHGWDGSMTQTNPTSTFSEFLRNIKVRGAGPDEPLRINIRVFGKKKVVRDVTRFNSLSRYVPPGLPFDGIRGTSRGRPPNGARAHRRRRGTARRRRRGTARRRRRGTARRRRPAHPGNHFLGHFQRAQVHTGKLSPLVRGLGRGVDGCVRLDSVERTRVTLPNRTWRETVLN